MHAGGREFDPPWLHHGGVGEELGVSGEPQAGAGSGGLRVIIGMTKSLTIWELYTGDVLTVKGESVFWGECIAREKTRHHVVLIRRIGVIWSSE